MSDGARGSTCDLVDRREGQLSRGFASAVLQGGEIGGMRAVVRGGGHYGAAELWEERIAEPSVRDQVQGDGCVDGPQPEHQGGVAAEGGGTRSVHAGGGFGGDGWAGARGGRHRV